MFPGFTKDEVAQASEVCKALIDDGADVSMFGGHTSSDGTRFFRCKAGPNVICWLAGATINPGDLTQALRRIEPPLTPFNGLDRPDEKTPFTMVPLWPF